MKKSFLSVLILATLSACGTSSEPGYYSLASLPGAVSFGIAQTIKIQRPTIPAYLDRPQFVRQANDFHVAIDDTSYWAEPIDRMLARTLADDLRLRLPASHVLIEGETISDNMRFTVNLNIDHFNAIGNGAVLLEGQLIINDNTGAPEQYIPILFHTDAGSSSQAITQGLSEVVGSAADKIVEAIK